MEYSLLFVCAYVYAYVYACYTHVLYVSYVQFWTQPVNHIAYILLCICTYAYTYTRTHISVHALLFMFPLFACLRLSYM